MMIEEMSSSYRHIGWRWDMEIVTSAMSLLGVNVEDLTVGIGVKDIDN